MEAEPRPYGVILEVVYYDRTKDIVFPEQNNAIEWLTRLKQEDSIERVNIRNATDEEWLNHWKIVQAFKDALQSFDKPIDERLLNLDFTV
jgi:hypothetical protein